MFTAKKNIQLIDYQDSYYYRQQRKKRRYKWLKLALFITVMLVALMAFFFMPLAQSDQLYSKEQVPTDNALIQGPQLLFDHPNPAMRATFPVDITANIEINGLVAYAEITQTFINPHAIALHGSYQFPLPESAAVKQLIIKIGDKQIIGEIMEKKAAQALYQQAKKQGKKASLVAQHRPNIFTNNIANIPAQSSVVVTLKFIMPVSFADGNFTLRLPLAITQRYQPKPSTKLSTNTLYPHSRSVAPSQSAINIALNSGVPITAIVSNSHKITTRAVNSEQNAYLISLNKTAVRSTNSFELSWQLVASEQPQVSSFTEEVGGEYYTLLTFFPPNTAAARVIARDIIFIIDTSGSMQGGSMAQAKASLQLALLQLNQQDSFNVIAFDDDTELLFPITQMASNQNITKAKKFIDDLNADGGTQMYRPLSNALMMKKNTQQSVKAIRQIVFITDGAVANEFELMQLLNSAQGDFRLYTVGIGAAPNGYFMKKAAQFGRGSYVFIQHQNEVQQKMTDLMTKISQPAISNIALSLDNQVDQQGHQHIEVYPKKIPDLYFAEPLQITLKSQLPITSVQLTGDTASTPWVHQLSINDSRSSKGISSLWARRKIESLLDSLVTGANTEKVKAQVIATSLNHQIISPYTSFIALEKPPKASPLLAKTDLSAVRDAAKQMSAKQGSANQKSASQKAQTNFIQAHQSLLVAMPQTAIGWQLQFLFGLGLLLFGLGLGLVSVKVSDLPWLANKRLQRGTLGHESARP